MAYSGDYSGGYNKGSGQSNRRSNKKRQSQQRYQGNQAPNQGYQSQQSSSGQYYNDPQRTSHYQDSYNHHHGQQQEQTYGGRDDYSNYNDNANYNESDDDMFVVDGSIMEGGGQILRNSIAYSALMRMPLRIFNIRAKRSKPGLHKQHSKGIGLVAQIDGGTLEGNYMKSMSIKYWPSNKISYLANYNIDIQTAGSICLIMQACVPLLLFSPCSCRLTCIGGTNAAFAPQVDWFILVLQPTLKRLMNITIDIQCLQRGFYPRGGGKVVLQTTPIRPYIPAFDMTEKGRLASIYGHVAIGGRGFNRSMGAEIIKGAVRELERAFGKKVPIDIKILPKCAIDAFSDGIGVVIVGESDTGCLFGGSTLKGPPSKRRGGGNGYKEKPGMDLEEVGRVAAREMITDWNATKGGCTDRHLQDQLIIFMALAKGRSRLATCALELHTETAIFIAEKFTGVKFDVKTLKDGTVLIECDGIGYTAKDSTGKDATNDAHQGYDKEAVEHKPQRRERRQKQSDNQDESAGGVSASVATLDLNNRPSFF